MRRAEAACRSATGIAPAVGAVRPAVLGVAAFGSVSSFSSTAAAVLHLRPSRLLDATLLLIGVAAWAAAFVSHHALWLKTVLLVILGVLLWCSRQHERQQGLRCLVCRDDGLLLLTFADGRTHTARYAGYALLGNLTTFIFFERHGWLRLCGPQRVAILRDATDADSFRRLRVRVRLGMQRSA